MVAIPAIAMNSATITSPIMRMELPSRTEKGVLQRILIRGTGGAKTEQKGKAELSNRANRNDGVGEM
jgi:hypothetical protein